MTENEKKLKIEIEKLKNENKILKLKNKDLEAEKKTYKEKLKIAEEFIEDLQRENKIKKLERLTLDYEVLKKDYEELKKSVEEKDVVVKNLTQRINKNSSNSSKPSSTDNTYTKTVHVNSNRKKGGKNGGQYGHKGITLSEDYIKKLIQDKKVEHRIIDVGNVADKNYTSKFVADIEVQLVVTEYRFHEKTNIPKELLPSVQYGTNSRALMSYLTLEMMSPLNKISTFMKSITNNLFPFSEGTIFNTQKALDKKLTPLVEEIKQRLIEAKVLHADESGVRVNGNLNWLHVYCTKDLVFYDVQEKRGEDAMDDIGILTYFVNILVHDHWKPYYKKGTHMTHAECNAHILRYLKEIFEIAKVSEVQEFIELLVKMNNEKKEAIKEGKTSLKEERLKELEDSYDKILANWNKDLNNRLSKVTAKKIPIALNDEKNLHDRLVEYKEQHLLFIKNFEVGFDNNVAERAVRIWKTKLNTSKGFRTIDGAKMFARSRSFLTTAKFREENLFQSLVDLFSGKEYKLP